jgi:hypothetical protein
MAEVAAAADWYAERGLELDRAFLEEVSRVLGHVRTSPGRYGVIEGDSESGAETLPIRHSVPGAGTRSGGDCVFPWSPRS